MDGVGYCLGLARQQDLSISIVQMIPGGVEDTRDVRLTCVSIGSVSIGSDATSCRSVTGAELEEEAP
jgi:hypothetical protein